MRDPLSSLFQALTELTAVIVLLRATGNWAGGDYGERARPPATVEVLAIFPAGGARARPASMPAGTRVGPVRCARARAPRRRADPPAGAPPPARPRPRRLRARHRRPGARLRRRAHRRSGVLGPHDPAAAAGVGSGRAGRAAPR